MSGLRRRLLPFLETVSQSSSTRDMWILTLGNSIGQIALLATMPFASRLYSPTDYGMLALYSSILLTGVSLSGLAYHQAIPIPSREGDGTALFILSIIIEVVLVALFSFLFVVSRPFFKGIQPTGGISFWFFPIGILWAGMYKIITSWCTREKRFSELALSKVIQGIMSSFVTLGMGLAFLRPLGLIAGYMISQGMGVIYLLIKTFSWRQLKAASPERLRYVAATYRRFPLYNTWSDLMNTLSSQLTPLILTSVYDAQVTGYFALSFQVINLPMFFIGMAVRQVFFQQASRAVHNGTLAELTRSTFRRLFCIGFVPFFLLTLLGPQIFSFLFGERWHMAGVYTQWIAPWFFIVFCTAPLYSILYILERQRQNTIFQAVILVSRIGALYLGVFCGGAVWSIAIFGVVGLVLWLFLLCWIIHLSGNTVKSMF